MMKLASWLTPQATAMVVFGWINIFFSAPGQTFLISLCIQDIATDLGLSATALASVYSVATLSAAASLTPVGRWIDRLTLHQLLLVMGSILGLGCLGLVFGTHVIMIGAAFYALRLGGQGLLTMSATTIMGKCFHKNRGKALSWASLGFSMSELIFPSIVLLAMSAWGWRGAYVCLGLGYLVIWLPLQWRCVTMSGQGVPQCFEHEVMTESVQSSPVVYSLAEVIRDKTFYWVIVASCLPPMIMTAILYHQYSLFEFHSWPIEWIPFALGAYAISKSVTSLGVGPFLDRYGPVVSFMMLVAGMGIGTVGMALGGPASMGVLWYVIFGAALGLSGPVMSVVWPNLYGTPNLGQIKGWVATWRNGVTAIAPLPLAWVIDSNASIPLFLGVVGIVITSLCIIPWIVSRLAPRIRGL